MTQPSSVLLVDADSHGLETLTYGFEREGSRVTRTSDLGRALQLAQSAAPHLAVINLREPEQPALEVIRALRNAHGRGLPMAALGQTTVKEEALSAGADDFLPIPTFIRDVVTVARLTTLAALETAGQQQPTMHLTDFHGLFYLLRSMAATERSVTIGLTRKGRRAELKVHEGTVVNATVAALQSLPALHHVLLWEDAALSLRFGPVPKRSQFPFSGQETLDECERFLRDFAHSARDLGAPNTLYVSAAAPGAVPASLQSMAPLLRLFDGQRVLADVIEESPFRIFDTVRMIRRLRDGGALTSRSGAQSRPDPRKQRPSAPQSMLGQWAMIPDQRGVVGDRRSGSRPMRQLVTPIQNATLAQAKGPIPLTHKKVAAAGELPEVKRRVTPAGAVDMGMAVTVQVQLDAHGTPLAAPMAPSAMPPLTAHEMPTPLPLVTPRQKTPIPLTTPKLDTPPPIQVRDGGAVSLPADGIGLPADGVTLPVDGVTLPTDGITLPTDGVTLPADSIMRRPDFVGPPPDGVGLLHVEPGPPEQRPPEPRPRASRPPSGPHLTHASAFDDVEADFFAREADLYKREAVDSFDDLDPVSAVPSSKKRRRKK